MLSTTHPDAMTPDQRLTEVAHILATAIRRLKEKHNPENISLAKSPNQWPYGKKSTKGEIM